MTSVLDVAVGLLLKARVFRAIQSVGPRRLTVLAYHRVDDDQRDDFESFAPNVGATPAEFERQLTLIKRVFTPVSGETLMRWIADRGTLPPRPALVTFDDGYRDNSVYALPILRKLGVPATVFLTSSFVGTAKPFYWDLAAYCFTRTELRAAELPLIGMRTWSTPRRRERVLVEWLETLKRAPHAILVDTIDKLPGILKVDMRDCDFTRLHMSWEDVDRWREAGMEVGAHTVNHTILTRVPPEVAREEIVASRREIAERIGSPPRMFAYPNGMPGDFNDEIREMVGEAGFEAAFTLLRGQACLSDVHANPLAIRRIFVSFRVQLASFAAKVMGVTRMPNDCPFRRLWSAARRQKLP